MSKYIVKNCPCNITYKHIPGDTANCCSRQYGYCYSISDCLIKRVIEKCESEVNSDSSWWCGAKPLAQEILDMFEIERVKE